MSFDEEGDNYMSKADFAMMCDEIKTLKAQLEVATSGYKAAVSSAQWQSVTNSELNKAQNFRVELIKITKQRDELLEALKAIIRGVPDTWEGVKNAKAAISKAEA